MATPGLPAVLVRDQLPPELAGVPDYEIVYPCYQRLPMGSSNSVRVLKAINARSLGTALSYNGRLAEKVVQESREQLESEPLAEEAIVHDQEWVDLQKDRRARTASRPACQWLSCARKCAA